MIALAAAGLNGANHFDTRLGSEHKGNQPIPQGMAIPIPAAMLAIDHEDARVPVKGRRNIRF